MERPNSLKGMRHVALYVHDLEACERFYCDTMGYAVEWRPDDDNVYLCGGCDNLALHRRQRERVDPVEQRLDHIGFMLDAMDEVDAWHAFFVAQGVTIRNPPKTHRDGARSFYCFDPDGTLIQIICHPPVVGTVS